jgi:hypothetical protein
MEQQSTHISEEAVLSMVDVLLEHLRVPLTNDEEQYGWTSAGKTHWHGIVAEWKQAVLTKKRAPAVPLNGKHLDNSGGGSEGSLTNMLENCANAIAELETNRSIWHRLCLFIGR